MITYVFTLVVIQRHMIIGLALKCNFTRYHFYFYLRVDQLFLDSWYK